MNFFQVAFALCLGISLSAACGFRVFVPLLATSLGVRFGGMEVNETLAWVGSDMALVCLSVATVVEILAYYIPWVDNALDSINVPLAAIAGSMVTAGVLPEMSEMAQWVIGIVAGGGAATAVQLGTTAVRAASTATTGGMGNSVVSTTEAGAATIGSVLALVSPILAIAGLILIFGLGIYFFYRWRKSRKEKMMQQQVKPMYYTPI